MNSGRKRRPIRIKVLIMSLALSAAALVLTSAVGVISMIRVQHTSRTALTNQMEQNMHTIVTSKANLADAVLGRYAGYIGDFARFIHDLYCHPSDYKSVCVMPPDINYLGSYTMQRTLASRDVVLDDVMDELCLLGNLERLWKHIIPENADMVTTVYAGTKSGFMLSYDRDPVKPEEGDTEVYYDHRETSWYRIASSMTDNQEGGVTCFTNVYQDAIGRGLTISCAAPFFNADGEFAGVVCMDILISELYRIVLDMNLGEGAYAFLVDRMGNLIELSSDGVVDTRNIYYDDKEIGYKIAGRVLRGKTGITLSPQGIYYAYTPIRLTGWKFGIRIPETFVLAPIASINQTVINTILQFD